jgi:hypothetical protein
MDPYELAAALRQRLAANLEEHEEHPANLTDNEVLLRFTTQFIPTPTAEVQITMDARLVDQCILEATTVDDFLWRINMLYVETVQHLREDYPTGINTRYDAEPE